MLQGRFPPPIFSKNLGSPSLFAPTFTFGNFVPPFFKDTPSKFFPRSGTFKLLLLGCQYGDTIVRRNSHLSNKMCKGVFVTN